MAALGPPGSPSGGCCTPPVVGKYCITTMKFWGCSDATGFTATWYQGTATFPAVPAGGPEATETGVAGGHCYTPAVSTSGYILVITKTGWVEQHITLSSVGTATVNIVIEPCPTTLAVTHDHGSGTLSAVVGGVLTPFANPFNGALTVPTYVNCFQVSGTVSCGTTPFSGTYAFRLRAIKQTSGFGACNAGSVTHCFQDTTVASSTGGNTYGSGTCVSGVPTGSSSCGTAPGTNTQDTDVVSSCGTPFSVTYHWTLGPTAPCDGLPAGTTIIATNSATVTY